MYTGWQRKISQILQGKILHVCDTVGILFYGVNNMFVESFHRVLKFVYLQHKQNRRVDFLLATLIRNKTLNLSKKKASHTHTGCVRLKRATKLLNKCKQVSDMLLSQWGHLESNIAAPGWCVLHLQQLTTLFERKVSCSSCRCSLVLLLMSWCNHTCNCLQTHPPHSHEVTKQPDKSH